MNNQKGFTIIELIVVIFIIAVLAAIVLMNVTQYNTNAKNTAIKGNLAAIATGGAYFYDSNSYSYSGLCTDAKITKPRDGIQRITTLAASNYTSNSIYFSCNVTSTNDAWCVCSQELPTGTTAVVYCVDSTGNKKEYTTPTDCATKCVVATAKCL